MSKFPSLPANPEMIEVFATHSEGFELLCDYHDMILRGPSPLSIAERELIGAYVSGLNQCGFCYVYAAGWCEKALFHTIAVTGIFNLMNRLVEGTGITADPLRRHASRDRAANELDNLTPYAGFAKTITNASETGILGDSMTGGGWEDARLSSPSTVPQS